MKSVSRAGLLISLFFIAGGFLFCTITDDLGNPAIAAPNTQNEYDQGSNTGVGISYPNAHVLADAPSRIAPGDTAKVTILVMRDTSVSELFPLSNAKVYILQWTPLFENWVTADSLVSDSLGAAAYRFTDTLVGDYKLGFRAGGSTKLTELGIQITTAGDLSLKPELYASPEKNYLAPGDTVTVALTAVRQDTSVDTTKFLAGIPILASTDGGWISKTSVSTDPDGRATILFSDTVEGSRELTFICLGVTRTIRLTIDNAPVVEREMTLFPDDPVVKADGVSSTFINVRVFNKDHNPLIGEQIKFISTRGVISGVNPPEESGSSGISMTNEEGVARAKLTSTNINDTAFITAILVSDKSKTAQTEVVFQGVSIQLIADSTNMKVGQKIKITAELYNGSQKPISRAPITYSLSKGANSNLALSETGDTTDFQGRGDFTVSGKSSGTDSIIVRAAGARAILPINVTSLSLNVSLSTQLLQVNSKIPAVLRVLFANTQNEPLGNKNVQLIRIYSTEEGAPISDTIIGHTNAAGVDSFTIEPLSYETSMRLQITAYNTATDVATSESTVRFIATRDMSIFAVPTVIQADGTSRSAITVLVKNELNNPMRGEVVQFKSTAGVVQATDTTDDEGRAVAHLISDRRNTIAKVTAQLLTDPTKKQSINVEFAGIQLTAHADPAGLSADGSDTATVIVSLNDAGGNPITGEQISFFKGQDETILVLPDSVTDNRGEARCRVYGTGVGQDTIKVVAAGAQAFAVVGYTSNTLGITIPSGSALIADGISETHIQTVYKNGLGQPLSNATVFLSVTMGSIGELFADTGTTDADGLAQFTVTNPSFTDTVRISALARPQSSSELTSASKTVYFRAGRIHKIRLNGSPEVISTNGDRAKITAVGYDSLGNRVGGAHIAFNMLDGPGGGEHLEPPTAFTRADGTAETYLVSGTLMSAYRGIRVVAGDFAGSKSDTVMFTIAGPPHAITIRREIGTVEDGQDGTYLLPCAAIVTDVNGNPVADGTEVTFSLQITGYYIYRWSAQLIKTGTSPERYSYNTSITSEILPFEDLNNNLRLDADEDSNLDGVLQRGEDLNGDGVLNLGPGFYDLNRDGRRTMNGEPRKIWVSSYTNAGKPVYDTVFADFNSNGYWDPIEPLRMPEYRRAYDIVLPGKPQPPERPVKPSAPALPTLNSGDSTRADTAAYVQDSIQYENACEQYRTDSIAYEFAQQQYLWEMDAFTKQDSTYAEGKRIIDSIDAIYASTELAVGPYDIDWNENGQAEPRTTAGITRTLQTSKGIAQNTIIYGQSDGLRIRIRVTAESNGVVTKSPQEFMLPITEQDAEKWSPWIE